MTYDPQRDQSPSPDPDPSPTTGGGTGGLGALGGYGSQTAALSPSGLPSSLLPSMADLMRMQRERLAPVVGWLRTNGSGYTLYGEQALLNILIRRCPAAQNLTSGDLRLAVRQWASEEGHTIRQQGVMDRPGEVALATKADLVAAAESATTANGGRGEAVQRDGGWVVTLRGDMGSLVGNLTASPSGASAGIDRGDTGARVGVGWGSVNFHAHHGPVNFGATISPSEWSMTLSFFGEAHPMYLERLTSVFNTAGSQITDVASDTVRNGRVPEGVSGRLSGLSRAISAASSAFSIAGQRISAGVTVTGPVGDQGSGPGAPPAITVTAGISIAF